MSLIDDGQGICQRMAAKSHPDAQLWEGQLRFEKQEEMQRRHLRARILCWRCPALEDCEARLAEHESRFEHVDGVVAGRYSIIRPDYHGNLQKLCAGCGQALKIPRSRNPGLDHVGEGLCRDCYPEFGRKKI